MFQLSGMIGKRRDNFMRDFQFMIYVVEQRCSVAVAERFNVKKRKGKTLGRRKLRLSSACGQAMIVEHAGDVDTAVKGIGASGETLNHRLKRVE